MVYPEVTDMFSMDVVEVKRAYAFDDARFCGLYVLAGEGSMGKEKIGTCDHFFVPAACGRVEIVNGGKEPLKLIRCFGPNE